MCRAGIDITITGIIGTPIKNTHGRFIQGQMYLILQHYCYRILNTTLTFHYCRYLQPYP